MTSRAPVPAAEIGQPRRWCHSSGPRRLRELEPRQPPARAGPADSRRDRPKDAGPGRRCHHGALPLALRVRPPGLPLGPGRLRYASAASERPWGGCQAAAPAAANRSRRAPLGYWRPRPRVSLQGPAGRLLVLTAAPGEPSLPACREAGTGPQDPGWAGLPRPEPGLGVKAGEPRRVAWVCSGDRSDRACAQSTAQNHLGRARSGRRAPRPFRCRSWVLDPERPRRDGRAVAPGLGLVPLAPGWGARRASSLRLSSSFAGKLGVCSLQPEGPAAPGLALTTPRAAASGAERLGFSEEAGRTRDPTRLRQPAALLLLGQAGRCSKQAAGVICWKITSEQFVWGMFRRGAWS